MPLLTQLPNDFLIAVTDRTDLKPAAAQKDKYRHIKPKVSNYGMSAALAEQVKEEFLYVGKNISRVDSFEKLSGRTVYVYDMELPKMLQGKVKRSECAHAKIRKIDVSNARAIPGVRAIITAKDIPKTLFGSAVMDQPVMAIDVVRYVGEPIAAIAAETEEAAQEGVEAIEVEYEELPALFDPQEAFKPNPTTVIHTDFPKYRKMVDAQPQMDLERPNVNYYFRARKGDVEAAFKKADLVLENRYTTPMAAHVPMETMACIASVETDGSVTIWMSTQSPFRCRSALIEALNLPASKVKVIAPHAGGGYGAKLIIYNEAIAAFLAMKSGRPVKLRMTREETFQATTVKHPFIINMKDGFMKDGTLLARQILAVLDGGAYSGADGVYVTRNCVFGAVYSYRIPNFKFDAYRVYTNKPIGGALRGFGSTQMEWAIETQMDIAAEKLGIDPVELRLKSLLNDGELNALNEKVHKSGKKIVLQKVVGEIGWDREVKSDGPWRIASGLALACKYSYAPSISSAEVKICEDETIEVRIGVNEFGQGLYTVVSQIVAEELKIPIEMVKVIHPNTQFVPYDDGGFSSRSTYNTVNAVLLAIRDLKKQVTELASKKMGIKSSELDVAEGRIFLKSSPSNSIRISELFSGTRHGRFLTEGGELLGKATWIKRVDPLDPETGQAQGGMSSAFFTPGAIAVEVAVNIETGDVKLKRIVCAVDAGKAINPQLVTGQIEGAVAMGIGMALHEEMIVDNGRVINADFMEYKPPRAMDLPSCNSFKTIIVEVPQEDGPFGARGVGEVGVVLPAPAIGNAVYRATGVRLFDLPITSERIVSGLLGAKV